MCVILWYCCLRLTAIVFDWHVFIVYSERYWYSNKLFWIELKLNITSKIMRQLVWSTGVLETCPGKVCWNQKWKWSRSRYNTHWTNSQSICGILLRQEQRGRMKRNTNRRADWAAISSGTDASLGWERHSSVTSTARAVSIPSEVFTWTHGGGYKNDTNFDVIENRTR